ncbi:hypothetical protein Enr10x_34390 [Gimesia panareensis]|uniref:Uncharacterized protein n=1 Tax=Gimesia panareensis TaxID=2527978 RepID=A0A517Q8Z6_9PLAN|nr:hypothetical protein Enr10x_34390 [Gimesia panareensis]
MMSNRSIPLPVRHDCPDKGSLIFDSFRKNDDSFKRSFPDSTVKRNIPERPTLKGTSVIHYLINTYKHFTSQK